MERGGKNNVNDVVGEAAIVGKSRGPKPTCQAEEVLEGTKKTCNGVGFWSGDRLDYRKRRGLGGTNHSGKGPSVRLWERE